LAKWSINPIAPVTLSSSQTLKNASLSSDCIMSIRLLHDAIDSWLPCLLLNIRQA
jgi:hypothetical protein